MSLTDYANDHSGFLPQGESSPEASLSLLNHEEYGIGAEVLRGKTVPLEVTQAALELDGVLGPESCGWHYVEGLTLTDNPEIAVIWDKVGLGHNGQRLPNGGHEVFFLSNHSSIISAAEWPLFLKNQEALLAARTEREINGVAALSAKIRLPSGKVVDHYDGPYQFNRSGSGWSSSGSGSILSSGALHWYRLDDGIFTFQLTLGNWISKELEVKASGGIATPNEIIFNMTE